MTAHRSASSQPATPPRSRRLGIALLATLLATSLSLAGTPGGDAAAPNPGVLAPPGPHYGRDYPGWVAAWVQWGNDQLYGPQADCGPSGVGLVWFLNQGSGPPITRSCTLPVDAPVFVPIFQADCSSPNQGKNEAELRACAKALFDGVTVAEATLDGVPLQDLPQYRVASPLVTVTHPTRLPVQRVADGYWLLLAPLAPGTHTLVTHGFANLEPEGSQVAFATVTYNLIVGAPAGGTLPNLPNTGAGGTPTAPFAGLGLALAFGGLLLTRRTRRGIAATPRA